MHIIHRLKDSINKSRARAKRRANPWNLVLIPLCLLGIAFVCWVLYLPIRYLQDIFTPEGSFLASTTEVGSLFLVVGLFPCAICPGLMLGNFLAWFVRPLRRIFDEEAKAYPSTNLKSSRRGLSIIAVAIFFVCYPIALLGGINYFAIGKEGLFYRNWLSLKVSHYNWTQIQKIETKCYSERSAGVGSFTVVFQDGQKINLFAAGPNNFFPAYPELKVMLEDIPFEFQHVMTNSRSSCPSAWTDYFECRP